MAIPIPTEEPTKWMAGDTVKWTRSFADYPANGGWELAYRLRGTKSYLIDFGVEVTASGADFLVNILASTSVTYAPGDYLLVGCVEKDGERKQVYSKSLTITPNHLDVAGVTSVYDPRTRAKRTLDAIEAMIEGTATREEKSYTITHGSITQTVEMFDRGELLRLRTYYANVVKQEDIAARIAEGKGSGTRILTKFA